MRAVQPKAAFLVHIFVFLKVSLPDRSRVPQWLLCHWELTEKETTAKDRRDSKTKQGSLILQQQQGEKVEAPNLLSEQNNHHEEVMCPLIWKCLHIYLWQSCRRKHVKQPSRPHRKIGLLFPTLQEFFHRATAIRPMAKYYKPLIK